jgi:hypothetical protein
MDHDASKENAVRVAHEKIQEGLYELLEARGEHHGMITSYVISIAQETFEEDGRANNYVSSIPSYQQPLFHTLGLLQSCVIRIESLIAGNRDVNKKLS